MDVAFLEWKLSFVRRKLIVRRFWYSFKLSVMTFENYSPARGANTLMSMDYVSPSGTRASHCLTIPTHKLSSTSKRCKHNGNSVRDKRNLTIIISL